MKRTVTFLILSLLLAPFAGAQESAFDYGDPTPEEQLVLEYINRARADPEAERVLLDIPEEVWGDYDPMPPLAHSKSLCDAARAHGQDMLERLFFAHRNPEGVGSNGRVRGAGYELSDVFGGNDMTQTETLLATGPISPLEAHRALILDKGVNPPNHRLIILGIGKFFGRNRQAGIGIVNSPKDFFVNGLRFKELMVQEFAHTDDSDPFVTGVAYRDDNGNRFYDPGEGLGGLQIETKVGGYVTRTSTSGGYAIPMDVSGDNALIASGAGLDEPIELPFSIDSDNVKVDFVREVPPELVVLKSGFKVNFRSRAKGLTNVDSLVVKAVVDPIRLPEDLDGLVVTVHVGDAEFGPFDLVGKGTNGIHRSPSGAVPRISLKLKATKGTLVLKISRADLAELLGVTDATQQIESDLTIRVVAGDRFDATLSVHYNVKGKAGKKTAGRSR